MKPHLWLIRFIGVIGAAALARRLEAGVGGRVALARGAVGRLGQARLAKQTRSAATQPGRVLGCAAFTTKKIGGRNVSRPAFWFANAAEESRLHGYCCFHAGAGNRREYGDLQRHQRRAAQTTALPRTGTIGAGLSE